AGKTTVMTIEWLEQNGRLHPVQQAWIDLDVPQCGYCQSGMMMVAVALLRRKPKPTDADIDAAITSICRCGTYQRVRAAIHAAARGGPPRRRTPPTRKLRRVRPRRHGSPTSWSI